MIGAGARFDPRLHQIAVLSLLFIYGLLALDFEIAPVQAVAILGSALIAQRVCTALFGLPRFDARSALISTLSLCLLLRTNDLWIDIAAATIAVASKFVLRIRGKHLFNPTNIALVALIACTNRAWVSPGQWGSGILFAFLVACVGGLVVNRAARSDVTFAFACVYIALVIGRSVGLGEPMTIPWHRLQSGALVIFTFFMISDPRTTPDSRAGRIVFAALVAFGAYYVQFRLFRTNGLLWSLAWLAPLVPLLDRLLPGRRYEWASVPAAPTTGGSYEAVAHPGVAPRSGLLVR
jgi:Na+-transporting NADH:ubiquinone oxidoreductase subunit NqrB